MILSTGPALEQRSVRLSRVFDTDFAQVWRSHGFFTGSDTQVTDLRKIVEACSGEEHE